MNATTPDRFDEHRGGAGDRSPYGYIQAAFGNANQDFGQISPQLGECRAAPLTPDQPLDAGWPERQSFSRTA